MDIGLCGLAIQVCRADLLTGWLEAALENRRVPPQPSAIMQQSATGQVLMVAVPEELTRILEERWNG